MITWSKCLQGGRAQGERELGDSPGRRVGSLSPPITSASSPQGHSWWAGEHPSRATVRGKMECIWGFRPHLSRPRAPPASPPASRAPAPPGQVAQPDLGWPSRRQRRLWPQPGASPRGHTSPGPARVKAAERFGLTSLSLKVVPLHEDGRAWRAETRAPAQLGLGEVPVRAACPPASLGPSPAVTPGRLRERWSWAGGRSWGSLSCSSYSSHLYQEVL